MGGRTPPQGGAGGGGGLANPLPDNVRQFYGTDSDISARFNPSAGGNGGLVMEDEINDTEFMQRRVGQGDFWPQAAYNPRLANGAQLEFGNDSEGLFRWYNPIQINGNPFTLDFLPPGPPPAQSVLEVDYDSLGANFVQFLDIPVQLGDDNKLFMGDNRVFSQVYDQSENEFIIEYESNDLQYLTIDAENEVIWDSIDVRFNENIEFSPTNGVVSQDNTDTGIFAATEGTDSLDFDVGGNQAGSFNASGNLVLEEDLEIDDGNYIADHDSNIRVEITSNETNIRDETGDLGIALDGVTIDFNIGNILLGQMDSSGNLDIEGTLTEGASL